jgi:hypothetical protein
MLGKPFCCQPPNSKWEMASLSTASLLLASSSTVTMAHMAMTNAGTPATAAGPSPIVLSADDLSWLPLCTFKSQQRKFLF